MASQRFRGSTSTSSNPETIPTPNNLSGPCPRCGRISNFKLEDQSLILRHFKRPNVMGYVQERADLLTCNGCQETAVVVTERFGDQEYGLMHVYPAPGAGVLDKQVNERVASAYDEGTKCPNIGANRAAAVMFLSALSLFVTDRAPSRLRTSAT